MKQVQKAKQQLNQSGSMHLAAIVAVVVVIAVIGIGVYVMRSQSSKTSSKPSTSQNQPASKTATDTSGVSVTLLGGKLTTKVVEGWTKGTEQNLIKDIDGTSFRIAIQSQGVDYLKLDTVGGYATELNKTKTTQGTTIYLLKLGKTSSASNVVLSTCAPTNGFGCSPDFDKNKLYVVLAPLGDGGTALAPLNYNLPATGQAISDFEDIVKALPL